MGISKKQKIIASLLACLLAAGVLFYFISSRSLQLFGKIISHLDTNSKVVALTFDDGPAQNTEAILHVLKKYNITASFFLTGKEMAENKELTFKIIKEGHDVGNHSWSHERMIFKNTGFIKSEVEETDKIIRQCGYEKKIFFRPPYCKKFIYLPWYLKKTNRTTVTWDVEPDSDPTAQSDPALILKKIKEKVKPGSIILLHATYKNRQSTLDALPLIIEWLQQNGYSMLGLNEMIVSK